MTPDVPTHRNDSEPTPDEHHLVPLPLCAIALLAISYAIYGVLWLELKWYLWTAVLVIALWVAAGLWLDWRGRRRIGEMPLKSAAEPGAESELAADEPESPATDEPFAAAGDTAADDPAAGDPTPDEPEPFTEDETTTDR